VNNDVSLLELRAYHLKPGTRERFEERLREVTTPIYNRLGFPFDRFWSSEDDPSVVYYLLHWRSHEEMERKWRELFADPEFLASREGYDSPVKQADTTLLSPLS
jgi:hypothetical protein